MWNDAPGLFEMMMKFFARYDENIKNYSKPFETACKEFLEEILLHYEKCALNHQYSTCEADYIKNEDLHDEDHDHAEEIKKEDVDIKEEEEEEEEEGIPGVMSSIWNVDERPNLSDFNVVNSSAVQDSHEEADVTESIRTIEEHGNLDRTFEVPPEANFERIDDDEIQILRADIPSEISFSSLPGLSQLQRLEGISQTIGIPSDDLQTTQAPLQHHPYHLPSRIVQAIGIGSKRNPTKRCRLCYRDRRARRETRYWCSDCPTKPGLCLEPCFRLWHNWPSHTGPPAWKKKLVFHISNPVPDPPLTSSVQSLSHNDVNTTASSCDDNDVTSTPS